MAPENSNNIDDLIEKANKGDSDAQFELGYKYCRGEGVERDCAKALDWYEKSAAQNNAIAQNNLGVMYCIGEGVVQDYGKALEWFEKSAEQGDECAQLNLGCMYRDGKGVEQDYTKAFEWYEKSAEQGDECAQLNLGCMYRDGKGVEQDYTKAFEWLEKSAVQNNARAQNNLGMMYFDGEGVGQDYGKALEWFEKSASQNDSDAQYNLGCMYRDGKGVEQSYPKSFIWFEKSALQGDSDAQFNLGNMYCDGEGVEQDYVKAMEWYEKSAEQGNACAQVNLGYMYCNGSGVEQNYAKALEWYEKSALQNNAVAQNNLGCMYRDGEGVMQDYGKALEWFEKSASQNNSDALYNLGCMYFHGEGVEQNYAKAFELFEKSASQNNAEAQNNLGCMYRDGEGVEQDYGKALWWYEKSAEQGSESAQYNLGIMYYEGEGVEQDYGRALGWIEKLALQNVADAQNMLGIMYENGDGVELDYAKALDWYEKSAEQGNNCAQYNLGKMYFKGKCVEQNYETAVYWFEKSASQNYAGAQFCLSCMYRDGLGVEKNAEKAKELWEKCKDSINSERLDSLNAMFQKNDLAVERKESALKDQNFDSVLHEYGNWLINEAEPPLSYDSANSYKSYIRRIREAFNAENPGLKFESLLDSYKGDGNSVTYADCSAFVANKILSSCGRELKYWFDRQSALHRLDDFLSELYGFNTEDKQVLHSLNERFSQNKNNKSLSTCVKSKFVPNVTLDGETTPIDTRKHKELMSIFLSRLKTQSRWYPKFGTKNGFLFPTRLLGKIFSKKGSSYWKQWMMSGLENMQILIGENDVCKFSEVESMNLLSNGGCSVCIKGKKNCKTLYTHTADGNVTVAYVNGAWMNISIDHIHPLENVLREKAGELSSFLELTKLFFSYKENCGFYLNPRAEIDWNEDFFKTYEAKLLEMSDDIVRDLEKLTFDYELMERHENTRKGAGGENRSAGFGFQNSSNISDSQKSAADRNDEIESLSLDEVAEVLKEKKKLALEEKIAPYIKQQKEMQEIQKRNKEYAPINDKFLKKSYSDSFVSGNLNKSNGNEMVTEDSKPAKISLRSFDAKRKSALVNGLCQFCLENGSVLFADEKGMSNSSLPWANESVEILVYREENDILTEWEWRKK